MGQLFDYLYLIFVLSYLMLSIQLGNVAKKKFKINLLNLFNLIIKQIWFITFFTYYFNQKMINFSGKFKWGFVFVRNGTERILPNIHA